jgi:gliding motility-associated-like protein
VESPKPLLNTALYNATLCDSDFDGNSDPVNFNTITPIIVTNFTANPGLFNVRYYLDQSDRDAGNNNTIPNLTNWTFSVNTTVYVRAESQYCSYEKGEINFKFGTDLPLISSVETVDVCDNDLNNTENIKLSDYKGLFTIDNAVTVKYFDDLVKAQNNIAGQDIPVSQDITGNKTFYLRFHKAGFCDMIGTLNINFKQPKKSDILEDKQICPEATITLDAGPGFDGYLWSTGETTQTVDVPVGDYWVDLSFNGCVYRQNVSVTAVDLPVITGVEIQGSTVTVTVTGGNPPYQYSIDGINWQTSKVFMNVRGGDHTIYVISADNCAPVTLLITVVEHFNAITPNGDGINDVLNYSDLLKKEEPFMQIFDRYGKLVFTGDRNNRFIWDGKAFGKIVPTGTYWYVTQYREPGATAFTKNTGWVLVKTRNND